MVLSDIWHNPPDPQILGLIVPKNFSPVSLSRGWAVAITYDESGFVKDSDADTIDYNALLKQMQEATTEANAELVKRGYAFRTLIGWAAPPHYDKANHKLYWAKEIEFADDPEQHTLNYCIRVLGRKGVLELNAIAGMKQLSYIEEKMPEVIGMVDFEQGHRYVDFDPKVDKIAGYGLAALVLGGVAAKAGLFKGLLVGILALKKFIIAGVLALGGVISRFFKRSK